MLRLMLAGPCALALTACAASTRSTATLPTLPSPPDATLAACRPTPVPRQTDGSATSGDAESAIRTGRADLAACDDKRRLLLDAWPR